MKKQAMIIMAAALALIAADASIARGGMAGGRMTGPGDYSQRAPDSALQTRDMTRDQVQIRDPLQVRDPAAIQDQLNTQDHTFDRTRDRIHQ
ncbi:MAG: hypothetical protein PHR30_09235 [Gallionellaceae bacterium]|nr:hypothetical protein [Gallionellaceae bacterium]MDD5365509.1 hypothetical protein [Gallionellaceae bacterium]